MLHLVAISLLSFSAAIADAADETFEERKLVDAALAASGIDDILALECYRAQVACLADDFRREALGKTPLRQAQALHEFLHQHVLHRYDADVTDLGRLLDDGTYNCLTATLLFVAIGRQSGLDLTAVQMPGHVRCVLDAGGIELELEPTCPTWSVRLADAATAPDQTRARRIDGPQLVAMFYYNRAIALHNQQQFGAAVAANLAALKLDPGCQVAYENLLATLHNWAMIDGF